MSSSPGHSVRSEFETRLGEAPRKEGEKAWGEKKGGRKGGMERGRKTTPSLATKQVGGQHSLQRKTLTPSNLEDGEV